MSSIWKAEWERRMAEERRAIAENEARVKNLQRNLNLFRGDNPLPVTTPKNSIPQIPNSTSFNPYTPYIPSVEPSTRIRDEVNEIIRRQNLGTLREYGPVTADRFNEWEIKNDPIGRKDRFWADRQDIKPYQLRDRGWNVIQSVPTGQIDLERQIREANRNLDTFNSPLEVKRRQFENSDLGPDSTIARLRRQAESEKIPTWKNIGPQTLDDYVGWLKKQGRYQDAADVEWENRKPYQQPTKETKLQKIERLRLEKEDFNAKLRSGNWVKVGDILLELTPGEKLARQLKADRDAADARWKQQFDRKVALNNGFNPDLSNSDRQALESLQRKLERENNTVKIPNSSNDGINQGLNPKWQDRTGQNNIVGTRNPFTRNQVTRQIDPYSGSGQYGGNGFNRLPNNPQGPNGTGFDVDQIMRPRQSKPQNIIGTGVNAFGVANGRGFGIPSMSGTTFADRPEIQAPTNLRLPGGRTPIQTTRGTDSPSTMPDRPYSSTGIYKDGTTTGNLQRFVRPLNRGVSGISGATGIFQQIKDLLDSGERTAEGGRINDALGMTPRERNEIAQKYGLPEYIDGLPRAIHEAEGRRRIDFNGIDYKFEALRALKRGESRDSFHKRYFGPQDRDSAELYRMDYKNGPIFRAKPGFSYGPFKLKDADDGYTNEQRKGLNDAARRSVGSYYGPGIGGKLAQLGRQISANSNSDYRRLLKEEQKKQKLERDESLRNRKHWDDLEKGLGKSPSQQRRQYIDPETARELSRWRDLDKRPSDPFENVKRRDLQKTEDWNRRNPEFFKDAEYKRREKELEFWFKNDLSKIGSNFDPFKPAPLPDPDRDPDYPPLPPGLKYPIWGWEIEAVSILDSTGSLIYWYSSYIKNADLEGDMPAPFVETRDNGVSFINNTGGWQTGRTGIWVLPNGKFSNPPAYVGGDESEIFTEVIYIEKWGILWTYPYNSPIWNETGNQDKQNEVFRDKERLRVRGTSNPVFGGTTITKKTPLRGKQPVPDISPQTPKPEQEDPIMPGCSYMPDKQNPAQVSWWDKITKSIKKKPITVHEGVDEGFEHVSKQMAELQEQISKISQVLDVDKYTAPQGKIVLPVLGMQAVTTVLGSSNPLVPIPLVKTLPQENMIFAAVNYMFSGHHLLGKLQLPNDPTKGADENGNLARMTPLTSMGYMHKLYNNVTALIGMPNQHSLVDANGVKTGLQFKNATDAMDNVHSNTVQMQQDISSLQEAVFKILQNQEMQINMIHKIGYQAQFLMDDTGARVKNKMVERPTVMKHGKKSDPLVQTGTDRKFSWETVFSMGTAATSVPTWDKSNELDKMQLGLKTNIEAQKAASSNFYPISAKGDQSIPSLKSKRDGTWESYVKTVNDGTEGKIYHGVAVPESKIELIDKGVKKDVRTDGKPFIDGRDVE